MITYLDGPGTTGALVVSTSSIEAKVGGAPLSERKYIIIQPLDRDVYWSYDSGLTTVTGHLIPEGTMMYISAGELLPVYLIAEAATDVRLSEVA